MKNPFKKNCCDGVYNSFDVHFTSQCDNKCAHCIDEKYEGVGAKVPDVNAILDTIVENAAGYDDVLFLGGEPCLYLEELVACVKKVRRRTNLKVYVTTAVPKVCHDNPELFRELISWCHGINLSVQHYDEAKADAIRATTSKYDRQLFYNSLPQKHKIRININLTKPNLYKKLDIIKCIQHYDTMGFSEIKMSEIQHGVDHYVSFEDIFDLKMKSPYAHGCQTYLDLEGLLNIKLYGKFLLKRSCFMCESSLKASIADGVKVLYQTLAPAPTNKYSVIYANGKMTKGWV